MKHKKTHKKDKKKQKKEKKHKKTKKRESSSSSSSDSEGEVWIEKGSSSTKDASQMSSSSSAPPARDDWMSNPNIFGGLTRDEIRTRNPSQKDKEDKLILDKPGQSERELNPYWRDGGTGLPAEEPKGLNTRVGDQGAAWLKKALQRAKEQADEQGRSLEEVVAERWGSLDKLTSMLREVERQRERPPTHKEGYGKESPHREDRYSRSSHDRDHGRNRESRREMLGRGDFRKNRFIKPQEEGESSHKHHDHSSQSENRYDSKYRSNLSHRGWKKANEDKQYEAGCTSPRGSEKMETEKIVIPNEEKPSNNDDDDDDETPPIEDLDSLNVLGAQIIKAEIMGRMELASELKIKLEKARAAIERKSNTIILTKTDKKGFILPLKGNAHEDCRGRKGKRKATTHESGKRVRYFADDDRYSLQDIFEQEKLSTGSDYDEAFSRLGNKKIGRDDGERDMEDVFEETAATHDDDKRAIRERGRALNDNRKREKVMDDCRWCLENKMSRDCIITMGNTIYLCVPTTQSLTEGHCLIVPTQHVPCVTSLDEDIWEEVLNLKRTLVSFYLSRDEDVIFFESALYLKKYPHMVINCVPVPKEIGDVAPIYFKKAILECEMEWSTNKKLVDLAGKGVRRAVPKGMSYFSVDFGMQDGYAHVIEDQKLFPNNFAQEIIGGMMDLDHSIWRKQRRELDEVLVAKVTEFRKVFQTFDPYKKEK